MKIKTHRIRHAGSLAIITVLMALASRFAFADIAIIGNNDTDVGYLNEFYIKNIFLGEQQSFPNGVYAYPVNHFKGSPDRKAFLSSVLQMSETQLDEYWQNKQLSNTGYRPVEVRSYEELLESVRSTPGCIGYIDTSKVDDTVKVLMTIKTDDDFTRVYANRTPGTLSSK